MSRIVEAAIDIGLWLLLMASVLYAANAYLWIATWDWGAFDSLGGTLFASFLIALPVTTAGAIYYRQHTGRAKLGQLNGSLVASSIALVGFLSMVAYALLR
jgi:hypothetical protein